MVVPMNSIAANELKTQGVSLLEARLAVDDEVIVSVRGKNKYAVITLEKYAQLREYELTIALQEAKADIAAGRFNAESVAEHIQRASHEL